MDIIKGPDFPTGAIVEGINEIKKAYKKGKGKKLKETSLPGFQSKIVGLQTETGCFFQAKKQVHILNCLAGSPLQQVVDH